MKLELFADVQARINGLLYKRKRDKCIVKNLYKKLNIVSSIYEVGKNFRFERGFSSCEIGPIICVFNCRPIFSGYFVKIVSIE
jgi:hypothetical protein